MNVAIAGMLVKESVVMGILYSVVALGFNLVYRVSKSINLAHPEIALVAAYAALVVSMHGFGFFLAVLVASAIGFVTGILLERGVARPLLGRPPVALIAATLGVFYLLRGVAIEATGDYWSGGGLGDFSSIYRIGGVVLTGSDIAALVVALVSLGLVIGVHRFTRLGVAMRAVAENPYGAAGYGLPVRRLTALSWGFAGLLGALGGLAFGIKAGVSPGIDSYALKALAASLLAGLDSIAGVVVGGFALSFTEQFGDYFLHNYLPGFGEVAAFIVMLVVLLFKPYGFFGTERIERL